METPDPNPWETLHVLSAAVAEATRRVERDSDLNEKRIRASVQKMRWFRRAAVLAVLAAVLSFYVGYQARNTANDLKAQRRESRIITCQKDNDAAERINALNDRTQDLLRVAAAPNMIRTPEQQARTNELLASELAKYEAIKVPLRDCSPAAVERFYTNK